MLGYIFSVHIKEMKTLKLSFRKLGNMTSLSEGVGTSDYDRIVFKHIHKFAKGKKVSFLFKGFKSLIQLKDCLKGPDGEYVPAFCYIRFHSGKYAETVKD